MRNILFALFVVILSACATRPKAASPAVSAFIHDWSQGMKGKDAIYVSQYKRYLTSVEELLNREDKKAAFDYYLGSLKYNSQSLSEREQTLPQLFQSQRKSRDVSASEYELFKTKHMTAFYDAIYTEREMKLKQLLGEDVYQKLRNNYARFSMTEETRDYAFPL